MKESVIQRAVRLYLGQQPDLVVWRNSSAATQVGGRWQKFGMAKGASDLIGILAPMGRFCAFEIKASKGRLSPEQKLFLELVRTRGGFACVLRSTDDAEAALARARAGAHE